MFSYPFFRQQQQQSNPRYYTPSQNPRKRYVRDEYGNVYLVPDNSYYPRNIDYPQQHRQQHQQQRFNPLYHEEDEYDEEDEQSTQFEEDDYYPNYHYHRPVPTPRKQPQHHHHQKPTRIPINTPSQQPQQSQNQQKQPTKVTTHKETKTHTLEEQTNAAILIQKVFRGRRVRKDSPLAKLSTLHSTQKAANELFLQADSENILEEGHVFEFDTPCVGSVPRALAQLDHELTKLLLVLDGVGSGNSEEVQTIVRSKRKEVAQNIELMLTAVDAAKKTCVIRPVPIEQPKHTIANTDTTLTSDSLADVEMQSVDCDNDVTIEKEQSNTLPLSSETTITSQTTNDTLSSEPSHNQPLDVDPAFEDITLISEHDQIDEEDESNNNITNTNTLPIPLSSSQEQLISTSNSEDWVVLPSDDVEMETTTTPSTQTPTSPSTTKPSRSTVASLKSLSYNACNKIIKSALLRTPVAC